MGCVHNDEYECFTCETARHDAEHTFEVDGCPTCKYRTIRISAAATPNKTRSHAPPKRYGNQWEKGIATDHRGVPYLNDNLQPIGIKEFSENRSGYETRIRDLKNSAAP